jgi:hypothetical protein
LTVTVAALAVRTAALPKGKVGTAYSAKLAAYGGTGTLHWAISSGSLPPGLKLTSLGVISGTPTTAGAKTFTVKVTDSAAPAHVATRSLTLTISP